MLPPTLSPRTASRVGSRPSSLPCPATYWVAAKACSIATGYSASGERSSSYARLLSGGRPWCRCRTDSPCTAERRGANGYTVRAIRWLEGPCSWLRLICLRLVSTELVPGTILRATPAAGSEGDRNAERHQRTHKCRKI